MTGKNFIGFTLSAEGNRHFRTSNPSTGEFSSTEFIEATSNETDAAVELASNAFSAFNSLEPGRRADFLLEIAREIELLGNQLIDLFCFESGLPVGRAEVERKRTLFQLRSFAAALVQGDWMEASIDTADANFDPSKPDLRKMLTGLGPVVVFGASNFPLAYSTAGGDTASAFAAGCPIIVKSHPLHAGTSELIAGAIVKAAVNTGMPDGVFSHLNAKDFLIGRQLVSHPLIKGVGFTGSLSGGKALFDLAAARPEPIPVFAEMGSINPVVVFSSAINSKASKLSDQLSFSVTNAAGQFCTKPGLIFLEESVQSESFIKDLGEKIASSANQVMLHESIFERFESNRIQAIKSQPEKIFESVDKKGSNTGVQTLLVVDANKFVQQESLRNEVFGPFAVLVRFQNNSELQECLSLIEGSLTTSVFSENEELEVKPLIAHLNKKAGRIIFNGVPTGVTVCPSMNHGGPFPATSDSRFTAVGIDAMRRFLRPVAYQNFPQSLLPPALKNSNELGIYRRINGVRSIDSLDS